MRYQNGSLLKIKRKNGEHVWALRWYEGESRTYRKRIIGTDKQLPERRDAERTVTLLRNNINTGVQTPQTVADLAAHYEKHELTPERKSFSTIATHIGMAKRYIEPKWGQLRLSDVRPVLVEEWLQSLPLAPASKTKIKSTFSVLYSHAIRYEWLTFNPISKVRTSSKRLREKDVLSPTEFQDLLEQLSVRDRAMVLLAGSTGLRRSEMIALTWADVNLVTGGQRPAFLCSQPLR